ncbi:leucine/isoleucine/valine transporter ATP-binding subunit [compost metagenome]
MISLLAEKGTGILLIEQFTQVALKLADTIYVMSQGQVVLEAPPPYFIENPDVLHKAYFACSA